jgi:hypothetical protein
MNKETPMKWLIVPALLLSANVFADDRDPDMQGPPTSDPDRSGLTVALGFGPGELHVVPDSGSEQRVEGPAFTLRVGTALSQTSAIEALIDFVDGSGTRSTVFGGDIKVYAAPSLYLRVGGGVGMLSLPGSSMTGMSGTDHHFGATALAAFGWEWFQLKHLALFGEFEAAGDRILESNANTTIVNAGITVGVTWF